MRTPDDLTGKRFGKLLVIGAAEPYISPTGKKKHAWNCVCDCGNIIAVRGDYLRRGSRAHCGKCAPPSPTELQRYPCRHCKYSKLTKNGSWKCSKKLNTVTATFACSGYVCGREDKVTHIKHREIPCLICGKPVYQYGNNTAIYCEEHRERAEEDSRILREAPMSVLFGVIAGIFLRARDDYMLGTGGYKKDAEQFLRSTWAKELSNWEFDADKTLKILDEVIEHGLE